MKFITTFVALVCAASIITGCSTSCEKKAECSAKPSCGMKCCADAKATCVTCPTCSAKK